MLKALCRAAVRLALLVVAAAPVQADGLSQQQKALHHLLDRLRLRTPPRRPGPGDGDGR